MIAKLQNGSNC